MEELISFSDQQQIEKTWSPLSDQVRGGGSSILMELQNDQTARIFGELKLNAQNAGFASYRVKKKDSSFWSLKNNSTFNVVIRGDGRTYKFLVKDEVANAPLSDYSWQAVIRTTADFQTMIIKIADLKPIYRGKAMQKMKPLDLSRIVEFGFQINDKKEGPFEFVLKSVAVF